MEKPDSAGYVNVLWPSKNVPHGGIFHTPTVEPTVEQQQFLKVLLEESKLSLQLRQKGEEQRRGAGEGAGNGGSEARPVLRPRTSRRRSLSAIRSSGAFEVDTYRPVKRGEDRERLKERLANVMAVGADAPAPAPVPGAALRRARPAPALPTPKETWNELVTQIRERAEWLAEMECLGHAAQHREIVQEQIAERMRALDALDLESECSSARSTTRSRGEVRPTARAPPSAARTPPSAARAPPSAARGAPSVHESSSSLASAGRKPPKPPSWRRARQPDENVAAYGQLTPLEYSPRRRV